MGLHAAKLLLLTGVALSLCGTAQTAPGPGPASPAATARPALSAAQVVQNLVRMNLERAHALPGYRSTRIYHAEYHGFPGSRSAEMVVDVEYKPPSTKVFTIRSQTGSKLIIDRVFKKLLEGEKEAFEADNQRSTALNDDNYSFTLLGYESAPEGSRYVLAVEPKTKSKFLYRGKIWVDAGDFAVTRIMGEPAKNPSFWIRQTQIEQVYVKVDEFWLPERNHSMTAVRLGGRADFTIEYKNYQLTVPTSLVAGRERIRTPR
jgi:hypothetical protein